MSNHQSSRILALSLSSRGFGYVVLEGSDFLVDYGHHVFSGDKNSRSLANIEKLINHYSPDTLVLADVSHRAPRIKELHRQVLALAKTRKLKAGEILRTELHERLLGDKAGTRQGLAELLAKKFPDELAVRLPPKRKAWTSEDARMDIFEAVALAVVFWLKQGKIFPM